MISEPEIDGDWHTASGAEGAEAIEPAPAPAPARLRSPRGRWVWALGGMVVASAVWAGTLAVQDRFSTAPRIDYRHSGELCKETELKVLGQAVGRAFDGSNSRQGLSPAQDWAFCQVGMAYEKESVTYEAQVLVQLHKKTDPGPEFATGPVQGIRSGMDPVDRSDVPGLGDRAVLDRYYGGGGERLTVLDGGAVFTLTVDWFQDSDKPSGVDEDAIDAAVIEDLRTLMAKLRR